MKRLILTAGIFLFVAIPFGVSSRALAHELLPQNVIQYIKENPEASTDELKAYIEKNAPEVAGKVKDQQDIIDLVNQDTSFIDNALDFITLGIHHILGGFDHILFVLSLLLVAISLAHVLKYTATFTVAHSLTIILAGSGALTLSSKIVEPIIALSIAAVALSTVFLRDNKYFGNIKYKLGLIFAFGLFHGLGFAGLLEEIQIPDDKFISSLISFNIGIEIGQLIIVAVAFPFLYILRNRSWYEVFIKVLAVVISVIALFWMFQRIFQ